MSVDDITQKVLGHVSAHPEIESQNIGLETNFREDLGVDSLVIAELTIELEDAFGIRFPDTAFARVKTVGDAVTIVKELL